MFGKFLDTSVLDPFVAQIVKELSASMPPARLDTASRQASKRRDELDERVRRMTERFAGSTRLNIYQKARLGTLLSDALQAAGYPREFSDTFSRGVVSMVALARPTPAAN